MEGRKGKASMDLAITGPLFRHDIPELCRRARLMLEAAGDDVLICDVGGLTGCDAVAVDALARLQLTARRQGSEMKVRAASPDLTDLIALTGLSDVLKVSPT